MSNGQVATLKVHIVDLQEQNAKVQFQLNEVERRVDVVERQQQEISLPSVLGNKEAAATFETLSDEAARLDRRARGLRFALGQLEEKLADARERLAIAERQEKTNQLAALTANWKEAADKFTAKIEEAGALADEAEKLNEQIGRLCHELAIDWDSKRASSLLEGQMSNAMRSRFGRIPWGRQIFEVIDFSTQQPRQAGARAEEPVSKVS